MSVTQRPTTEGQSSGDYVFIDHSNITHENVEGQFSGFFMRSFTDPSGNGYMFNESDGSLSYCSDFGNTTGALAILGETAGTDGLNYRMHYSLYCTNKTPCEADGIQILGVYDNGTVSLRYHDTLIVLKAGDEWMNETSSVADATMPLYQINFTKADMTAVKVNTTIVDSIKNDGMAKKSGLSKGLGMI